MAQNTPSITNIDDSITAVIERARKAGEGLRQDRVVSFPDVESGAEREPTAREKMEGWCRRRGIPLKYYDATFDSFKGNDKLVEALKQIAKSDEDIVLFGGTGSGKTHLAIAVMHYLGRGHFTTVPELLLRIRSTFKDGAREDEADVIRDLAGHELLVLDDLGAEKTTEYSITTFYLIIDRRIRDGKRTIVTTNLTLQGVEEKLDARIASRLSEMMNVKINMPDYRKKR